MPRDQASLFSLALALNREGQYNDAIAILDKLSAQGKNPKVYVNLGNCYIGLYNFEEPNKHYLSEALQYYEKAIAIKPSAAAYYNLSAISRELLDFNKGEEYFQAALAIDRVAVAGFRSISGRQTNRLVVDETLSPTDLWDFLRTAKHAPTTFGMSLLPAPAVSAGSIMLIVLFYFLIDGTNDAIEH